MTYPLRFAIGMPLFFGSAAVMASGYFAFGAILALVGLALVLYRD